jgi:hypothetical protein
MAKIEMRNNRYGLGGSKDTDLEGIDGSRYDVMTDETKLAEAQSAYPNYDWFASFTVADKSGQPVDSVPEYTVEFDKPASGQLYYYYKGSARSLSYADANDKGKKKRVRAKLTVGDPPIGIG